LAVGAAFIYFLVYWRRLFFQGLFPIHGDTFRFYYPTYQIGKDFLRNCWAPLWDPFRNLGQPFLASPQNQVLYPLHLASAFLNFANYQRLSVFAHTAVACYFSFRLARAWFKSTEAGWAAALGMGFNGLFYSRMGYSADFCTMAWLPCALDGLVEKRTGILAMALVLEWLAGFPPFFLLSLLALLAICGLDENPRAALVCLAKGALIAGGLCAVQGLPFLEMLKESQRGIFLPHQSALENSVPPVFALRHLFLPSPFLQGYVGDYSPVRFYDGPVLLALAGYALFKGSARERIILGLGVAAFLLSLGKWLVIYPWIPFVSIFRFPCTWLLLYNLSVVVAAAAGVSRVASRRLRLICVGLVAADLLLFSIPVYSAWCDQPFLENNSRRLSGLASIPAGTRIFHSLNIVHGSRAWQWGSRDNMELFKAMLVPSYGAAFGLKEVCSHHDLTSRRVSLFVDRLNKEGPHSPLFEEAGVSRIVALTREGSQKPAPEASDVGVIQVQAPRSHAFLLEATAPVKIIRDEPGSLTAETTAGGTLVFSESYYPGWRAWVDGRPESIKVFENVFSSVEIPTGKHEVRFAYRPLSFMIGLAITLLTAGLLAASAVRRGRRPA